jgi:prepilin-type processing-associated H-X9-DG protein
MAPKYRATSNHRLSILVGILPFVEQQPLWEKISNPLNERSDGGPGGITATEAWYAMGPTPQDIQYPPWATEIPSYRCPSDPGEGLPALGRTNYVSALGDSAYVGRDGSLNIAAGAPMPYRETQALALAARAKNRGFFKVHDLSRFRDISDGLSNTIAAAEIATDLGDRDIRTMPYAGPGATFSISVRDIPSICQDTPGLIDPARPRFWAAGTPTATEIQGRGYRWAEYFPSFGGAYMILPPNRELCGRSVTTTMLAPPSSRHPGGCHVLMGDGAVKFVTDSIEAGNSRAANVTEAGVGSSAPGSQSPYGLWGALGTRASSETIKADF